MESWIKYFCRIQGREYLLPVGVVLKVLRIILVTDICIFLLLMKVLENNVYILSLSLYRFSLHLVSVSFEVLMISNQDLYFVCIEVNI